MGTMPGICSLTQLNEIGIIMPIEKMRTLHYREVEMFNISYIVSN